MRNAVCRYCGKSAWEGIGDLITIVLMPRGFVWWHPECVEWCDWKWIVSREECSRILTELTRTGS